MYFIKYRDYNYTSRAAGSGRKVSLLVKMEKSRKRFSLKAEPRVACIRGTLASVLHGVYMWELDQSLHLVNTPL